MSCFSCNLRRWSSPRKPPQRDHDSADPLCASPSRLASLSGSLDLDGGGGGEGVVNAVDGGGAKHKFTLRQLAAATENFRAANLIGEGGFGRVYRGRLASTGQVVAIKQLNRRGAQGSQEFMVECMMLMMLHHPHLVCLIGYCAEADERLLVYEFMPRGSLDSHLFDLGTGGEALDWNTRVKIAQGSAKGLRYLHEVVSPPVIYRDLKPSNILLADDFSPKLSDFGLAKLGPVGDNTHVSTRVMGTYGYCAPDYAMSGKLNVKSDVYSFGVLLLELITGRKAFDASRPPQEQRLLVWARPYLMNRAKYLELADPLLQGRYPRRAFYQLSVVTSLCLHDKPNLRPSMSDVSLALDHIASQPYTTAAARRRRASSVSLTSRRRESYAADTTGDGADKCQGS